ncbi:MAG: hypothetical protein V4560_08430 [Bacteroidota bacterium]
METKPHILPRIAITGIGTGLLMMAFFTTMWAGIAGSGLSGAIKYVEIGFFAVLIIGFIASAVYFFIVSKHFPKLSAEADKARGKKEGMWFGIIFGAEGLFIFLGINIAINMGHAELVIPVIALVVGLHFYPMAKIFKRSIDYYIATWSTLIALCSIWLILHNTYPINNVIVFLGIGMAVSTSCYGLYMIYKGTGFVKRMPLDVQSAVL